MSYLQHCKICLLSKCYFLSITRVSIVAMFVQPAFQNLNRVFWEVTATLPHSVTPSWMAVTSRLVWPSSRPTHLMLNFGTRVLLIRAAGWYESFPCWNRNHNTTLNNVNEAQAAIFTVIKLQGVSASPLSPTARADPTGEECISDGFTKNKTERKLIPPQPTFTGSWNENFFQFFCILFTGLLHKINCKHHVVHAAITFWRLAVTY